MKTTGTLLTLLLVLVSCGPISMDRSFSNYMDEEEDYGIFSPGRNFNTVAGDPAVNRYDRNATLRRTPAAEKDYPTWSEEQRLNQELNSLVNNLSPEQRTDFEKKEHMFQNTSQKLYYLGLDSYERLSYDKTLHRYERQRKYEARNPASRFYYSPRAQVHREIEVGMDKGKVIQRWGNPHRIDTAGNPALGNERWTFYENGEKKYVYFSQGSVEGWSLE